MPVKTNEENSVYYLMLLREKLRSSWNVNEKMY